MMITCWECVCVYIANGGGNRKNPDCYEFTIRRQTTYKTTSEICDYVNNILLKKKCVVIIFSFQKRAFIKLTKCNNVTSVVSSVEM